MVNPGSPRAIAASADSPYRNMGLYLAARSLVRQVMLTKKGGGLKTLLAKEPSLQAPLLEAEKLLGTVLANPKLREAHAPARRLLGFIRFRLAPEQRLCELYSRVLEKGTGTALEAELIDLTHLDSSEKTCPGLKGDASDLEAWLRTTHGSESAFPEQGPKDYAAALARWKKTSRLPWLVTALMKARPGSPGLEELLEDTAKVPVSSPAGVTVAWYSGHLLRDLGRADEARQRLAQVTPEMTADLVSTDNLLRAKRLLLATSWDEAFRNVTRRVAGESHIDSYSDAISLPLDKRPTEWKQLVEAGNAVSWFGRVAVEWAGAHPEDPRSPVALYRVVRASKRGCGGQGTKEAKAAFRLLHQRYAKTDWARRAPYVY